MSGQPRYQRVLLKVSGEGFGSPGGSAIEAGAVASLLDEIVPVVEMGVQVALVVGGGNIVRARDLAGDAHVERVTADYMGMLGTVINALCLRDALAGRGIDARVLSAIPVAAVCEPFVRGRAIQHLNKGRVVVFAGGTGSPFFTTDTCASLRASEIEAQVLLKATKVDGVFDSDPEVNADAQKYDRLTYPQVLTERLGVMDLTAVSMCMESKIPIVVFQLSRPGSLARVVCGEDIGTTISE